MTVTASIIGLLLVAAAGRWILIGFDEAPREWDAPEWRKWVRNQAERGGSKWL